jgi:hypothetical protein
MLYGDAIYTGAEISPSKDGITTVTFSFQGTGQLAWSSGAALKVY